MTATTAHEELETTRELAEQGELDLATIEAARLLGRRVELSPEEDASRRSAILSDLGALRYASGDGLMAATCLQAALVLDDTNELARENLGAIEIPDAAPPESDTPPLPLQGARVLEIGPGPCAPDPDAASWRLVSPDALAGLPDGCADVACCTHGLGPDPAGPAAEVARILRPDGRAWLAVGPAWWSAQGHGACRADGTSRDLLPAWGHLLLEGAELAAYLTIALGPDGGASAAERIETLRGRSLPSVGGLSATLENAGLTIESTAEWGPRVEPTPAMAAALADRHGSRDHATPGLLALVRPRA